jgi:hypothetical protein
MGILQNENAIPSAAGAAAFYDYQIEQSCRFDAASTSYFNKTYSSAGNRRTGTLSVWVKRGSFATQQLIFNANVSNADQDQVMQFNSSGSANVVDSLSVWWDGATYGDLTTTQVFRDSNGWNHIVISWDSTQSTASNRTRIYLNGTEITSFTTWNGNAVNYPTQNREFWFNGAYEHAIGRRTAYSGQSYFDGYLAEAISVDGTQYAPTQFGEFKNGVWIPKDPSGTSFGTNGFHLKFENASDLGNDSSGNNNDFTANNMGADHQVLDSPTFGS